MYGLFPFQYTYINASPTRPFIPWLPLFPLPYSLHGPSRVTLWQRSIHLRRVSQCARGQCNAHTRRTHYAYIQTRVCDKERKKSIQEHTSSSCPYILPLSDHFPDSKQFIKPCTTPRTVFMKRMNESFLCIWHTYLDICKTSKDNRDSVAEDTEGALGAYYMIDWWSVLPQFHSPKSVRKPTARY